MSIEVRQNKKWILTIEKLIIISRDQQSHQEKQQQICMFVHNLCACVSAHTHTHTILDTRMSSLQPLQSKDFQIPCT